MHKYKESQNVQAQIMYQRDQLQSKISLRWQGKQPQHNPLFTASSSSNWVWVGWLHIIKIQARCEILLLRAIERKSRFDFLNGRAALCDQADGCDVCRSQISKQYHSYVEIIQRTDFNDAGWNTKQVELLNPRVAFEGCIWKAIKSQPCAEGCSLPENRATPKNLFPDSRIRQVCLCLMQLRCSKAEKKKKIMWIIPDLSLKWITHLKCINYQGYVLSRQPEITDLVKTCHFI